MLIETTLTLTDEALAGAMAKAIKYATADGWLGKVKVHALQRKPAEGVAPWADAACLSGAFLFRLEQAGKDCRDAGAVWTLDNGKLAKGVAKLAACDAPALGRIAAGKGTVADCQSLLQLSLFGRERF